MFYAEQPVDWLMTSFRQSMGQRKQLLRKPTLFQHFGVKSSFDATRDNLLKDRSVYAVFVSEAQRIHCCVTGGRPAIMCSPDGNNGAKDELMKQPRHIYIAPHIANESEAHISLIGIITIIIIIQVEHEVHDKHT